MFNVKGVTTPTIIQQGDADIRVPISQGYEFYHALKEQGVPTRMLVLPRQPHGPTEPKMQLAAMKANLEWFEKYLGGKTLTSQMGKGERGRGERTATPRILRGSTRRS
jgi:dipeptidyl aminopeptidase/acylaminoacyl peptidase